MFKTLFSRRKLFSRRYRPAWVLVALVLALAVAFTFQPVRTLANDLLSLFRVRKIQFVEVNPANVPDDETLEMEVFLAECEVWDHVTVYERVYEQDSWCACDVTTEVELGQEVQQGTGDSILWPNPAVPAGGRTERVFDGTVIFQGDGYTHTTTTDDLSTYMQYLTSQYYIGVDKGEAVKISKNPKR